MAYPKAITELRHVLSDTNKHKRSSRKKIIGEVDGSNVSFRTFDKRIIPATLKVYVDGAEVDFTLDDSTSGELTLAAAPSQNQKVTASYYWQWWLDDELKTFLNKGAESVGQFTETVPDDSYTKIMSGLHSAALLYAAYWALHSLIFYLSTRTHSSEFVIEEDGNTDANDAALIDALRRQADQFRDNADIARDDFWKRLGQRNKPSFGIKTVGTRNYGPGK